MMNRLVVMIGPLCCLCGQVIAGSLAMRGISDPPGGEKSATTPPVASPLDPAFEKRLADLDGAMLNVVDFKANFHQSKQTPLLKKPLVSRGVLTSKGGLVRWETTEPQRVICLIDPSPKTGPVPKPHADGASGMRSPADPVSPSATGEIRVYYPADRLCEIYPIGGAVSDFAGVPLPRITELRKRFSIRSVDPDDFGQLEAGGRKSALLGIELRPISAETRKYVESIKVLIDESIPAAIKVIVTDGDGERTEITLSAIRLNGGLKEPDIRLTLPEDVRLSRPLGNQPQSPEGPSGSDPRSVGKPAPPADAQPIPPR